MKPQRSSTSRGLPFSIVDLMKTAHIAGRNGIDFEKVMEMTNVDPDNPKASATRYLLILLDNDCVDWDDNEQRANLYVVYKLLRQRFEAV